MTGTALSIHGVLFTLSVLAGIHDGRRLTATQSVRHLSDLPQRTPMLKVGIPCLILAVVAIHLVLAHPALSLYLPLGFKTIKTALSLATLLALCTYAFTSVASVAFRTDHPARWLVAGGGLLVVGIDLMVVWGL